MIGYVIGLGCWLGLDALIVLALWLRPPYPRVTVHDLERWGRHGR